jgi:hypothetical protein
MMRVGWLGALGVCAGLTLACGGNPDAGQNDPDDDIDIEQTAVVNETGCLTASGGRYVLTALETGGNAATEMYQLVGNEDELRRHVGREVRVTGDAEPSQVAELRDSAPSGSVGTAGSNQTSAPAAGDEAQVRTETSTRLETRQLRVATVTPTGDECPAGATP